MAVRTKITVGGTEFSDYQNLVVSRSMSDFSSASSFTVIYDSPFGRHNDDFDVGDELIVFANQDAAPTTELIDGIVEKVTFKGRGAHQIVQLKGRDFSLRLMDSTVEPVVFTDSEISTIVTNIIDENVDDITTNNVDTTEVTLARIAFNHTPVFEAVQQLAELAGFIFYVDNDKDLHFEKKQQISSGITLDNTNIIKSNFNQTREGMANSIWVYGDRYLAGFQELNRLDGSAWEGAPGSVFILLNKPHSTRVEYLGSSLKGGIFNLNLTQTSGPDYLVNFHDRELIFQSGTEIGYNAIPASGGSIISIYDREIPIVKFGEDRNSITLFGKKVNVINDKTIRDPNTATDILKRELEKINPFKGIEANYKGWADITVGNTVDVTLSDFNISETGLDIINVQYIFDKNTVQSEDIIKFRLNKKITDLTDEMSRLRSRITALESQDRQDTDVLTRFESATGSYLIIGSYWVIQTKNLGSSFILGHPGFTGSTGDQPGGRLGSIVGSGVNFLGDSRSGFTVVASGGNFS